MKTVTLPQDTHESKALFGQAMELLSRNRVEPAMKKLEAALQICPRNPAYLSYYGLCVAIEREDFDAAKKLCESAIRIDRDDPVLRVNLGKVLRLEGDNRAAHDVFLEAWRSNRFHPAPASELSRMGIRRPPVLRFLPRSHWANIRLGKLRAMLLRGLRRVRQP